MPSLRQLLAAHAPLLLIDAASARVHLGWLATEPCRTGSPAPAEPTTRRDQETPPYMDDDRRSHDSDLLASARWEVSDEEAGVAIFSCVEKLGVRIEDAGAYVFCDGPGSVLGIRTAAMALRTWRVLQPRPVFAYTSLALVAHANGNPQIGVIADARRDAWHHYQIGHGLRRLPTSDVSTATRELVMPEGFRHWAPLPAPNVAIVPYALADLLARTAEADLFLPTEAPDAFLHEEPSYVTWTPQIHRAPGER